MTEKRKRRKTVLLVLLIFAVAVTSAWIGTLAKYVTSDKAEEETIVAKFGLNVPNSIDLFSEAYDNVVSDTEGKKVIAPGTGGQYVFQLTGTSEVAYRVSAEISVTYSDEWGGYKPLEFSLDGEDWLDADAFKTALSEELESTILSPNTTYDNAQTIHWRWQFYTSDENDVKDTALGVAASSEEAPTVTVEIKATAVQVD